MPIKVLQWIKKDDLCVYLDEYLTFLHTTDVLATAGGRALGSSYQSWAPIINGFLIN